MQSTNAIRVLPAFLFLAHSVAAQQQLRVVNDGEWFHQEANGRRLGRLARGVVLPSEERRGDWVRVTIEGWIWSASVSPTTRNGFDLAVTASPDENLRAAPAGPLVAKLAKGFLLTRVEASDRWIRVRRSGWVRGAGLEPATVAGRGGSSGAAPVATPDTAPAPHAAAGSQGAPSGGPATAAGDAALVQPARATSLYRAPDGPEAGSLATDTPLRVLGRTGEWTRVQVEGWVRSDDLQTAPSGALMGVSAAELRAEPERFTGRVLSWTLQYLATRTADDLRPDIPRDATYLLARGPLPERGFVYVVITEERRPLIETLAPLSTMHVTVRVRAGRSHFIGNPVVDLLTLEAAP